jgi:hypothetical protein
VELVVNLAVPLFISAIKFSMRSLMDRPKTYLEQPPVFGTVEKRQGTAQVYMNRLIRWTLQVATASQISEWLRSPGLQPPN